MYKGKFVDFSPEERDAYIREKFVYDESNGWLSPEGEFVGESIEDVSLALIDSEDAEINSIGDCMTGFCVTPPKLTDFVRKKR